MRIAVFITLSMSLLSPTSAQQIAAAAHSSSEPYQLVIDKSRKELLVKLGNKVIRHYHVATGSGGKGTKHKRGDNKTPIGVYHIVDFNTESQFYFFMQLSYPNMLDAWYGYKHELIDAREFRAISNAISSNEPPPQDTALGGYIGIHGIGETNDKKRKIHAKQNWTAGCIALTNKEIMELRQYVSIGTQVVIHE